MVVYLDVLFAVNTLMDGETLIAAAGVFVTQGGVAVGENGVSFVWQKTLSQVKAG